MENQTKFTNNQLLIGSLIVIILILGIYIFVEVPKIDTEQIMNTYYNAGIQDGFNMGYTNASRDMIIELNQKNLFPCLNFETREYKEKDIGGLCKNG